MKAITATEILTREINFLERKRSEEFKNLKEQLHVTVESLKPVNLLKSTFEDVTQSPDLQSDIGKAAIGMVSGYFLKKLVFRSSINPFKILAGVAFQALATNLAAKNSDKIKETGINLFAIVKDLIKPKKKEDLYADIS